jgi:hypothetical protein
MPSVFLSYARANLEVVDNLVLSLMNQKLNSTDISIWRDQEKLYGGQKWPQALGEAISKCDFFLLAWSSSPATSHFVQFKWTIAIALRKKIITCMLDETGLPPSLAADQAIDARDLSSAAGSVLKSITVPGGGFRCDSDNSRHGAASQYCFE